MTLESKQISERIERPVDEVYEYAADPANLPGWAPGLGSSITEVDGQWWVETPSGRVGVEFAPRNEYGVLDHNVVLPSGEVVYNPLRVFANQEGCEIVFTVRRLPGMSAEEFERDAGLVRADLSRLKQVLESKA
ncbi:MAG: polyketide cyclase [Catenulispora sp. 13_1_20CM_3_70_7]|nr:SRPBCC family protein [Catenulisporales bacterium]OLE26457.1 MAG: polyketide cyclase [Catenulispora sp. 13_1_20CM_3_70_7]